MSATQIQSYVKPSAIDTAFLSIKKKGDIVAGLEAFENKTSPKFGVEGDLKYQGRAFQVSFKAYVDSEGVVAKEWAINGKSGLFYTLSVTIDDEADIDAFGRLASFIESDLNDGEWSIYNPVKGEAINLNLKTTGGRFNARFNGRKIKVDDETGVTVGSTVDIVGIFSIDYSFEKQQAKLVFTTTRVKFGSDLLPNQ